MKKLIYTSILALLLAGAGISKAQDMPEEYLGLPGDNLNLYAVMDLFQKSETLEGFERSLNDENSRINNLDLNGDNLVDYIMVSDYTEGNVHNIVLRVALNQRENQDVAVFIVEKFSDGSVSIQLIGDEALYGKNYIIEPIYAETPNPGYRGNVRNTARVEVVTTTYWDIARWPVVVYIYRPSYFAWRSAWYWGYWPSYWYSWTPYYWHYYYGYHYNWYDHYYAHYHHWDHYRGHWYNDYYYNRMRIYSPTVVVNVQKNYYRNTYSRPDLRKEGEAYGARAYAERGSRSQYNTNNSRDDRRSVNQTTGEESRIKNGTTTTERRTTGTVNNGSRTYNTTGRSNGTTSRPTTTVKKSTDNTSTGRTYGTTSRPTTTVKKSTDNTSTGRTYGTTSRPTTTVKKSTDNTSTGRTYGTTSRPTTTVKKSTDNTSTGRTYGTTSRPTTTVNRSTANVSKSSPSTNHSSGSVNRTTSSGSYKSSGSSSSSRSSGSVSRSSSSSGHSSGTVTRSSSSGSHKSSGSPSTSRSSSSGSRSASDKSSSSHSRR